ncbi:MAG: PAAR domain-containing protein [Bacteroidetes bacterium]|nr:PAAR domain-containing protein [Bacteroidota bacterium]
MGKPAARLTDMHVCPMVTPGVPPIPHVGGPIMGPGAPTVLIGGMPAAVMGDMCTCTGPPDTIILGSMGVLIGGKPAARMGDMCAHGGTIVAGCPTVLIGEIMPGGPVVPVPPMVLVNVLVHMEPKAQAKAAQIAQMKDAAANGSPLVHNGCACPSCAPNL